MRTRVVLAAVIAATAALLSAILAGPLIPIVRASLSRDTAKDALQPVRLSATISISGEGTREQDMLLFLPGGFGNLVPAGKLLVIESVAVNAFVPRGQGIALVSLLTTLNGAAGGFPLMLEYQSSGTAIDSLSGTYPVRLYADPSTKVRALVSRGAAAGSAVVTVSASGYLRDAS